MTTLARHVGALVLASGLLAPVHAHADDEGPPPLPAPAPTPEPPPLPAPAPAEPAPAPRPAEAEGASAAPHARKVVGRFDAGYTFRRVLNLDIGGVEASGGLGGDPRPTFGAFGRVTYGYGTSHFGLPVHVGRLDGGAEAIIEGRVRLGGSLGIGTIVVERATGGSNLWKLGIGLGAHATVDVVKEESFSLYLGVHGEFDAYPHLEKEWDFRAVLLSGGLRAGVRF